MCLLLASGLEFAFFFFFFFNAPLMLLRECAGRFGSLKYDIIFMFSCSGVCGTETRLAVTSKMRGHTDYTRYLLFAYAPSILRTEHKNKIKKKKKKKIKKKIKIKKMSEPCQEKRDPQDIYEK